MRFNPVGNDSGILRESVRMVSLSLAFDYREKLRMILIAFTKEQTVLLEVDYVVLGSIEH